MTASSPGKIGSQSPLWMVVLVTLIYLFLLYSVPALRLGMLFFLGRADLWGYFGPAAFYFDHAIQSGIWPEWNPLLFCGTPFAANPQSAVYYPPHLLRGLLNLDPTPAKSIVSLFIAQLGHMVLAATGMFAFCRAHGRSQLAAAAAGLLYIGSAALCFRVVQHWQFVAFAAWLPWLLLALVRSTIGSRRHRVRWALVAGVIYGLTVLIGFPQLSLYLSLYAAIFLGLHCLLEPSQGQQSRLRQCVPQVFLSLVVMVVVGVALAAPMLVPAAEFAEYSARAKGLGEPGTHINPKALEPWENPAALLKALVYFPGSNGIRLIGTGALLLALYGGFQARVHVRWLLGLLFLAAMDLCLGPPFPLASLTAAIAPFQLAGPERAALFAVFPLAVFAAFAVDGFRASTPSFSGANRTVFVLLGLALVLVMLNWTVGAPDYDVASAVAVFPCLVLAVCFLPARWRSKCWAAGLLLTLVLAEQALWNQTFLEHLVRQDAYRGEVATLRNAATWESSYKRGTGEKWLENAKMYQLRPVMNGYDPLVIEEVREFLCAPQLEDRYNRRIGDWEVTSANQRGNALLKRRFWLVDKLPVVPQDKTEFFTPLARTPEYDQTPGLVISDASPNNVTVTVPAAEGPQYLLFLDAAYPGWIAEVDGSPTELLPACGPFQAIALPTGAHEVELQFRSTSVRIGQIIGAASFLIVLAALAATFNQGRWGGAEA